MMDWSKRRGHRKGVWERVWARQSEEEGCRKRNVRDGPRERDTGGVREGDGSMGDGQKERF